MLWNYDCPECHRPTSVDWKQREAEAVCRRCAGEDQSQRLCSVFQFGDNGADVFTAQARPTRNPGQQVVMVPAEQFVRRCAIVAARTPKYITELVVHIALSGGAITFRALAIVFRQEHCHFRNRIFQFAAQTARRPTVYMPHQ